MDRVFTIQAGQHYADGFHAKVFLARNRVRFEAIFYPDCLYVPQENPGQINKLFGLSWGRHHNCSARIGWRSDGDRIELLSYVYVAKEMRLWRSFGMVSPGERLPFSIERDGHRLRVEFADNAPHHFHLVDPKPWGYYLFPYFGGKIPAPHLMRIHVRVVDCDGRDR